MTNEEILARLQTLRTDADDVKQGAGTAMRNAELLSESLDTLITELTPATPDPAPEPAPVPPPVLERIQHGPGRLLEATTTFGASIANVPKRWRSGNLNRAEGDKAVSTTTNFCQEAADQGMTNVVLTVPLAWVQKGYKADPTGARAAMRSVANGAWDKVYQGIAETLNNLYPNAVVRLGHEHNGMWYPWSSAGENAGLFVAAFQRVAYIFRMFAPHVAIDWNVAYGGASPDGTEQGTSFVEDAWPGNELVDVVGGDAYSRSQGRNLEILQGNLQAHDDFAAAHGKPVSYPEVGVTFVLEGHTSNVAGNDTVNARVLEVIFDHANRADLAYLTFWGSADEEKDYRYRPKPTDTKTWAVLNKYFPKAA